VDPIPAASRRDDTAGDLGSLVDLGWVDPQPVPAPSGPPVEAPVPDPADEQEAAALSEAIAEAGVTETAEDQAAVQALTKLDPATVAAVTRWVKAKNTKPETVSSK
jgi:hypothetical protein